MQRVERQLRGPVERPVIFYHYDEGGKDAAATNARAEWEREHGPIGARVPIYFSTQYDSRPTNVGNGA